jgi:hypothetical protein
MTRNLRRCSSKDLGKEKEKVKGQQEKDEAEGRILRVLMDKL